MRDWNEKCGVSLITSSFFIELTGSPGIGLSVGSRKYGWLYPTLAVSAAKVGKPIISSSMADNAPPLSEQRSYTLIKDGSTSTL